MRERPLSKPPESIRPGRTIAGKYQIESLLGTGAMGTVWVATHLTLGSKVAVKLVSPDFARSLEARQRFLAEAKAAAALRSRYVVHVYDSGVTEGAPYIVMEYLRGESLEERLQRLGRVPPEQWMRILGQVAKGLARAHTRNIIHRDLKPANIFLASTEDGEEVAKILDFGIAKMEHEDHDYKATATGVIMGTPLYMSPEQARGLKSLDHTSDLYSLGMVSYSALVGDVPFHAESFGDLVYTVCTQELPNLNDVAPWLPSTLDPWFRRACHKDQTKRFNSPEEMYQGFLVAAQLSYPALNFGALPDSVVSGSFDGHRARISSNPGASTGSAASAGSSGSAGSAASGDAFVRAAASTVPFSSADEISDLWTDHSGKRPVSSGSAYVGGATERSNGLQVGSSSSGYVHANDSNPGAIELSNSSNFLGNSHDSRPNDSNPNDSAAGSSSAAWGSGPLGASGGLSDSAASGLHDVGHAGAGTGRSATVPLHHDSTPAAAPKHNGRGLLWLAATALLAGVLALVWFLGPKPEDDALQGDPELAAQVDPSEVEPTATEPITPSVLQMNEAARADEGLPTPAEPTASGEDSANDTGQDTPRNVDPDEPAQPPTNSASARPKTQRTPRIAPVEKSRPTLKKPPAQAASKPPEPPPSKPVKPVKKNPAAIDLGF